MLPKVDALAAAIREHTDGEKRAPRELDALFGETRLTGWLRDLFPGARVEHRFASVKATDELKLWIRHLALQCAARPGDPRVSLYIGLKDDGATLVRFGEMSLEEAHGLLADLVRLYHLGQTLPLCFFPATSLAYANAKHKAKDDAAAESAARALFLGAGYSQGARPESEDPYVEKVLAGRDPVEPGFRVIKASPPGEAKEPTFADLALAIFEPLLAHRGDA